MRLRLLDHQNRGWMKEDREGPLVSDRVLRFRSARGGVLSLLFSSSLLLFGFRSSACINVISAESVHCLLDHAAACDRRGLGGSWTPVSRTCDICRSRQQVAVFYVQVLFRASPSLIARSERDKSEMFCIVEYHPFLCRSCMSPLRF